MIAKSFLLFFVLFISGLEAGIEPLASPARQLLRGRRDLTEYEFNSRSGYCYKFHRQGTSWPRARMMCSSEGADLAVAYTDIEVGIMKNIFSMNPSSTIDGDTERNVAFVGIHDRLDGYFWKAVDGRSLTATAFTWAYTEPNNARGNEYCGTFGRSGKLYDDSCDIRLPFICKKRYC